MDILKVLPEFKQEEGGIYKFAGDHDLLLFELRQYF